MPGITPEVLWPGAAPGFAGNRSAVVPTIETAVVPGGEDNARFRLPRTAATNHMWLLSTKMGLVQTDVL